MKEKERESNERGGDKTQGLHNFGLGGNKRENTDMGGGVD